LEQRKVGYFVKMLRFIFLLACASLVISHQPDISEKVVHLPNGDESEIVSIDLRKGDGTEDIKLMARVRFHLHANQIYINGQPVRHNVVTRLRMRVTITEIENGVQINPRLAPVIFRVLVLEHHKNDGSKQIIVEEEFIKVEEDEVMQVDVKQVVWDGANRHPSVSIMYKDSHLQQKPIGDDHRVFVTDHMLKPHLPNEHGYMGMDYHRHHHGPHHGPQHHHHHHHQRNWRNMGTITMGCAGIVTVILLISLILCWRRHCINHPKAVLLAPKDKNVVVDGCHNNDEKNVRRIPTSDDDEFHIQMNDCYIEVSDKKSLVEK